MPEPRYTAERNVQILISALKAHGVSRVVASPGTTNLTFVASIQDDPFFTVYSAPDERSAAYMACGFAAESGRPVVITCTGATASRNYLPGLTEAYYRKLPVLAVTGTLDEHRSGHLTAQFVDRSAHPKDVTTLSLSMPLVRANNDEWHDIVTANRAILELTRHGGGPVHINLETGHCTDYSVRKLPPIRVIRRFDAESELPPIPEGRVAIFVGAHVPWSASLTAAVDRFCAHHDAVVFCDHASNYRGRFGANFTLACYQHGKSYERFRAETLIHIGEVSGDYPSLHTCGLAKVWRVSPDGEIRDTFRRLVNVFEMSEESFFSAYAERGPRRASGYVSACQEHARKLVARAPELPFSNIWMAARGSRLIPAGSTIHFGVLHSFRSWTLWPIAQNVIASCNTGGFGIDGCLSTLLGASFADEKRLHFAVLGDLAFFYDMNALGNRHVGRNLRILLVNNGKGVEFRNFNHPAAQFGDAADRFVAAGGHYGNKSPALVRHYAEALGFDYLSARTKEEFEAVAARFFSAAPAARPMLLEAFTDSADDSAALKAMTEIECAAPPAPPPRPAAPSAGTRIPATDRRIAVLTFHAAFNCGAQLQAWALQTVLRRFGFDPEFPDCMRIGYVPRFTSVRHRGLTALQAFRRELNALGFEDVKRHRYRMFARRCLNIVPLEAAEVEKRYSAVLVGSDQVWNTDITRLDAGYFLTTVFSRPDLRRYSYAISLGDKAPDPARLPILSAAAGLFENLSLRENLAPGLRDRQGRPASLDPDPTLLLDAAAFNTIAYPRRLVRKPYLLVYSLVYSAETWAAARAMAQQHGLELVIVQNYQYGLYRLREGKGVRITVSPDRFLAYFRDAEMVVTSSFHGTAFALLYGKPFAVLPNHDGKVPRRSSELLAALGEQLHVVDAPRDRARLSAALAQAPRPETQAALARLRHEALARLQAELPDLSGLPPRPAPEHHARWTWPFRKLRGGLRCLSENGIGYTVKHLLGKVLRLFGIRTRL